MISEIEKLENRYFIDWIKAYELGYGRYIKMIEKEIMYIPKETTFVGTNLYYYKSIVHEEYIIKRIMEKFGKLPEFVLEKEKWIRLIKIEEIIK